jgi:hypothetical protein
MQAADQEDYRCDDHLQPRPRDGILGKDKGQRCQARVAEQQACPQIAVKPRRDREERHREKAERRERFEQEGSPTGWHAGADPQVEDRSLTPHAEHHGPPALESPRHFGVRGVVRVCQPYPTHGQDQVPGTEPGQVGRETRRDLEDRDSLRARPVVIDPDPSAGTLGTRDPLEGEERRQSHNERNRKRCTD